jgi:hypothetical protein
VWGSLSLPSSSQNLKPLATAKVTISGDLDCCRFGKKPPSPPFLSGATTQIVPGCYMGCLFGWRKETTSLHVKLTNLSRYFVGWKKLSGKSWTELNWSEANQGCLFWALIQWPVNLLKSTPCEFSNLAHMVPIFGLLKQQFVKFTHLDSGCVG